MAFGSSGAVVVSVLHHSNMLVGESVVCVAWYHISDSVVGAESLELARISPVNESNVEDKRRPTYNHIRKCRKPYSLRLHFLAAVCNTASPPFHTLGKFVLS